MSAFDPARYGPVWSRWLAVDRRRPLGPGQPRPEIEDELARLTAAEAFGSEARLADPEMAVCCLAGTWLLHDFLERSHALSQEVDRPEGSYWHGILHRREGDFSNAKYWFRRVGRHPTGTAFRAAAARLAAAHADRLVPAVAAFAARGDLLAFADLCQAVTLGRVPGEDFCRDLQQLEWELLFAHCYRLALG